MTDIRSEGQRRAKRDRWVEKRSTLTEGAVAGEGNEPITFWSFSAALRARIRSNVRGVLFKQRLLLITRQEEDGVRTRRE